MRVDELVGRRIGMLTDPADPAVHGPAEDLDSLWVVDPPPASWAGLRAAGYLVKPDRVTWIADTGADDRAFLAGLARKEREGVSRARRLAARAGLRWERVALDDAVLDEFLGLYEPVVAAMEHGLPVARYHRDALLAAPERFFAVQARDDAGALLGAVLGEWCPAHGVARARFSAVAGEQRLASLSRVLYLELVGAAREAGYQRVTLGNDPNLYGHLVQTGLFSFKARLGFRPVPSTLVDPADGQDVAERLLTLRGAADPSFVLAYPGPKGLDLRLEVFSHDPGVDTTHYTACLPVEARVHHPVAAAGTPGGEDRDER